MRYHYRPTKVVHKGRWWFTMAADMRHRTRPSVNVDGPDYCHVMLARGNGNGDDVWSVGVDLHGTFLGGLIQRLMWWHTDRVAKRPNAVGENQEAPE